MHICLYRYVLCLFKPGHDLTTIQPHYVSHATSILTGLHGACLLVVTVWFIYQLKYDSVLAGWIRIATKPVTAITDRIVNVGKKWIKIVTKWIGTGMKWIKLGMKWVIKWIMKWIMKWVIKRIKIAMKWIWAGMRRIRKIVKGPYEKYKQNLHLRRNIYWYFHFLR